MVQILGDVARENQKVKKCKQDTNRNLLSAPEYHTEPKGNLQKARNQDYTVFTDWNPVRHLCLKFCPLVS
jgi:hypothetical protein